MCDLFRNRHAIIVPSRKSKSPSLAAIFFRIARNLAEPLLTSSFESHPPQLPAVPAPGVSNAPSPLIFRLERFRQRREFTMDVRKQQPPLDNFRHFGFIACQSKDAQPIGNRAATHLPTCPGADSARFDDYFNRCMSNQFSTRVCTSISWDGS
jgi:hypothetical protein